MNPFQKLSILLLLIAMAGISGPTAGQPGESPQPLSLKTALNGAIILPFYEPWDQGSFVYQDWQFIPAQGNWTMNTGQGNPAPAAFFTGNPAVQNYEVTMMSTSQAGLPWVCANIYLEFDYMLNDLASGGTEKLIAEYYTDSTWFPALEIKNEGSSGWVHQTLDISQVCGKWFRIGFKAAGTSSTNITSWAVDNIKISPVCKGPAGCGFTRIAQGTHLFWQHPCDSILFPNGFNVYRTNESGNPPFNKLNASMVAGLEYNDIYPSTLSSAHFRYVITYVQRDPVDYTFLCEAPCDTLIVDYVSGIQKLDNPDPQISLDPSSGRIEIKSGSPIVLCELFSCTGQRILAVPAEKRMELTIPVSGQPSGIYLVNIKNASGTFVKKVAVMH